MLCYCLITLLYHCILVSHTWFHLLCLQQELGSHIPGQLVLRTPGPSLEYWLCSRVSENDPLEHSCIPCPEFLLLNVKKLDYWKVYMLWALKSDVKYTRKSALLLKSLPLPPVSLHETSTIYSVVAGNFSSLIPQHSSRKAHVKLSLVGLCPSSRSWWQRPHPLCFCPCAPLQHWIQDLPTHIS